MRFTKEIARPAKYLATALDGVTRIKKTLTADMLKLAADTGSRMIEAGLKIPAPYKHGFTRDGGPLGPGATPGADENAGYWDRLWYDDEKQALMAELDSPDADKVGKTIKEVSPLFKTFTDGQGRTWENAPYHIALVTHPIMSPQANFEPVAEPAGAGFAFALSDIEELLLQPSPLSGQNAIAMSEPADKTPEPATKPAAKPATDSTSEATGTSLKDVMALLEKVQGPVQLPKDTTPENFMERLAVALQAVAHATNPEPDNNQVPNEEPPPVAMSQGENTVAETNPILSFAEAQVRKTYIERVESLVKSGRIAPVYATQKLKPAIEGFALSFGEDGQPGRTTLDDILEALEAIPENTILNVTGKPKTGKEKPGVAFSFEEAPPEGYEGVPDDETLVQQADEDMKKAGVA